MGIRGVVALFAAATVAGCMMEAGTDEDVGSMEAAYMQAMEYDEGGGGGGGSSTATSYPPEADTDRINFFKKVWNVRRGRYGVSSLDKRWCLYSGQVHTVSWTDRHGDWWTATVKVSNRDGECIGMRGPACDWRNQANYQMQSLIHDVCCHVHGEEGTTWFAPNCGDEFGPEFRARSCDRDYYGMQATNTIVYDY